MEIKSNIKSARFTPVRRAILGLAVAACLPAWAAAAYPEQPVTLIVPYPPGGTTDIAARAVANAMQEHLGQTLVVENKPGAGGNVGMALLSRAKPDGYTIAMGTIGTQSINQFLYQDMGFDPAKDFEPIALVMTAPNVISVRADSPYKTLADLVEGARKGQLSYGTPGIGSSVHMSGVLFEQQAGVEMLHVPFKGVAHSLPALAGGHIDVLFDNLPSSLSHIKSGERIRALAVTSPQPSPSVPDVPTANSAGLEGLEATAWFALYAPSGTPDEATEKLIDSARKALAAKDLQDTFIGLGAQAGDLFGDELKAFEEGERERWGTLIKERKIEVK